MFKFVGYGLRLVSVLLLTAVFTAGCYSGSPGEAEGNHRNQPQMESASEAPESGSASDSVSVQQPDSGGEPQAATADSPVQGSSAEPSVSALQSPGPSAQAVAAETPAPAAAQSTAKPAARNTAKPVVPAQSASSQPSASTPARPSSTPATAESAKTDKATLTITGDSESGVILPASEVEVKKGDSVIDILKRVTRKHKIQMEFQGAGPLAYIIGIDNLYEYDKGAESGWMYKVNGEFPDLGAGAYDVNPGDRIEWLYTLDLGRDIGAKGR